MRQLKAGVLTQNRSSAQLKGRKYVGGIHYGSIEMRWMKLLIVMLALGAPAFIAGCGDAHMSQSEAENADDGELDAVDAEGLDDGPEANSDGEEGLLDDR